MRQKRAKSYKKQMSVYLHNFKFRQPYQTIIDDSIIIDTMSQSFDLIKGINRTIQDECKPMITQCCIHKLYLSNNQPAIDLAKTFERRKCNHKTAIEPIDCIQSIVNIDGINKHRYVVASNNYDLRKSLRKIPGVPMIFMNRAVMVMEPLSEASKNFANKIEQAKLTGGLNDAKYGKEIPTPDSSNDTDNIQQPKKRKGPSGPNPLSVKKKKSESSNQVVKLEKKPRRRKHKSSKSDSGDSHDQQDQESSKNHEIDNNNQQDPQSNKNDEIDNNNKQDSE